MGYVCAAALVFIAAVVTALFGVDAERRPLEEAAEPLSAMDTSTPASTVRQP